jgi:hypothetical protein
MLYLQKLNPDKEGNSESDVMYNNKVETRYSLTWNCDSHGIWTRIMSIFRELAACPHLDVWLHIKL